MGEVSVLVDDVLATVTDMEGSYRLENISSGTYSITLSANGVFYPGNVVSIFHDMPRLPDCVPSQ